ncbi:MAG: NADH-quinone oxidoreductase subunit M [Labilithrix sp.]|nr:NADH-quinone oxidoreductase subunit M [Labilithrix sp.]
MLFGPPWRAFRCLLFVIALVAMAAGTARAEESRRAGTVRLETASQGRGPIELKPDPAGRAPGAPSHTGELVIVNDGKEPLVVSRIAVRGDSSDPRAPPKLSARMVDGSLPITIPPGASRKANIAWSPERTARQRQLFGHVVVTTSDEQSGDVAMGVRAQPAGILGRLESHVLSLLVGVPLLGAIATFLARAAGRRDERTPHLVAIVALGVQALLAAWVYRGFTPDVSRADGNDGLQFIEHVVWIRGLSAELFLGVDGIAATALLVTSVVAFLAVLPERTVPRGASGYHAGLLVLHAAVTGAVVAMDGLLFLLFSSIAIVSAGLLVGAWGGSGRRSAAMRLTVPGLFAIVLFTIAIIATARQADPTFLVDGTRVTTTFSLPELSRVALSVKGATLLGGALVKVCFVMVLVASLFLLAAFPAHGWLGDVLVEAPPAAGILVAAALPTVGLCGFLRVGCAVLPEGMRWASGVVVALGAIAAAYGALSALGQSDLRRMTACATTTQAGFVLMGAGSLTPQGLSGAIVLGATRALACGAFLLLAAVIRERVRTSDATRLGGVASQIPGWATALAAAGLAQAGVLGLGGAWGPLLALLGVLSSYAPLAIVAAIALVVIAAAHLSAISRVAFGPLDPEWEKSELLEPFGGRFPDLTGREWTSIAPLVVLVVLLGFWPAPVVAVTTGTVRDLANAVSPPGPDQVASR